jgi:hypothetical protein
MSYFWIYRATLGNCVSSAGRSSPRLCPGSSSLLRARSGFVGRHIALGPPSSRCASTTKDGSTRGINRCNAAPTPTGFAEFVGDDFPVLHVDSILRFSSVQSGHMVSLGKLRADCPELASWTISSASSNEYRPASARRFVYP